MKINEINNPLVEGATNTARDIANVARGVEAGSDLSKLEKAKAVWDRVTSAGSRNNPIGDVPKRKEPYIGPEKSAEAPPAPKTKLTKAEKRELKKQERQEKAQPTSDKKTEPAKAATAATDPKDIPKKGMFQSDDAYLKSLSPEQLERVKSIRQAKQAAGIQNDKNIADKVKEKPIKSAAAAAAVAGGTAYVAPKVIDKVKSGMAADEKEDELEKQKQSSDTKPATGTDTKPATPAADTKPAAGDGTISNPSKNSPFYVPADNDSRENKPYPPDSRYGKEDAAKADIPKIDAIAPNPTSSGYKGSKGSQAIQALNPDVTDVNKIRTGQELKMPDGSTYTVKQGDALDRIARNAGLSPKQAPVEKPATDIAPTQQIDPLSVPQPDAKSTETVPQSDVPAEPTRDYSSGRPVDKELDDKYGTGNTRTADDGRTYVRQKGVMGQPDSEQRSYASFGDFFNKIRGQGDINGKVTNESLSDSTLNTIKKLSSITESKITQVDNNMDLRKLLAIMSETKMADLKGKKHGGSYGNSYDSDEEGEDSPTEKKTRGGQEKDSTKDSKKWQGADNAADAIIGGKAPKKEVGTKSVKHSIKEWMQAVEESLNEDEEKSFVCVHAKKGKCEVKAKTSYEAAKKAADKWKMKSTAGIDTHRADKPIHVDEAKDKKAKKDYDKDGKIETGAEEHAGSVDNAIKKNMKKKQVKEGVNLHKMMTEKQTKVDEMLEELQQEIAEFKTTGEMGDKLRDALDLHTYTKGATLIGEGDQELADKFHDEDMARLGDEGKADAQHMKDLDRSHDESTADLWRMKDLARDSTMGRADAISLREEDHAQGDTVYHRGQIGIVDRIEGNKCFVHKPNGDMDVWPTEECSKKKQGHFDIFKKDVQDVGAGFGRFLKGKSELDESPFAFESKKVKEEEDQPRLKTTKTDTGSETTSSTGRIKATFEPGKETKVEPVKESMAYDVWNHQLEKMINESMIKESLTVTTTKGDNGTDDSVSVTASGNDASDIMAILRNAGIGSMGNEEEHIDHPTSAYGAPEGESVGIVKIDGPEVIDGDDTMLGLMKKIADISNGNSEHQVHDSSDDYADENCEQEVDEGNAFTGALKKTPQGGKFEVDGHEYTDTSSLEEGHGMCSECGTNMYETDCGHRQMVDEDDVEDAKVGIAAGSPSVTPNAGPANPGTGAGGVAFNQAAGSAPTAAAGPAASNAAMSALTGGASAPNDQTAAMPTSQSTAASASAAPTSNIKSRTADEIANTGPMGIQKPSAADKAAGDRTLNSIKNFFGGGKPDQAAQDKAGSAIGQGYAQAQAATDKNVQAQNTDVAATAARDQMQKDMDSGKTVDNTNIAQSQINPAVLGKQAGATTKATGKVSYAPNAGGVTKTASANPAQKLASQNKAGSKIGQGYAQAALAETDDESAEVGLEEAEYANSDDDAALQDIKYMTNFISGGLNGQKTMHKHGYQHGDNPLAIKESTDPLVQWKKLSGLQ